LSVWDQNSPGPHGLGFFEPQNVPRGACPTVMTASAGPQSSCPVLNYFTGGPGFLSTIDMNSYQSHAIFTDLLQAAGHHVIKAGAEASYADYTHVKAYSGGDAYQENTNGFNSPPYGWSDYRNYAFMTSPDHPFIQPYEQAHSDTLGWAAFLQDSWQIFDKVTLNVGVRYDGQIVYGTEGQVGLSLPNQWAPRVGLIYDFTQQGRSKIYANYARYYEGYTLDMADRSFPSESNVFTYHDGACSTSITPSSPATQTGPCTTNSNRLQVNNAYAPSRFYQPTGGTPETIDPNLMPQATDEFVLGGEYEVFPDARVGISYTHRDMVHVIEDMSDDEAKTYFVSNPGYGLASDFPKATRNYDAGTVYFQKTFSNTYLVQASYTLSRLYGNYAGLFRPETGQLDPNITSDFDLRSLLPNQTGNLPGDTTHVIKVFGAKDFYLPAGQDIVLGLSFKASSGEPIEAFGAHVLYGPNEVFLVPRGTGGTLTTRDVNAKNYGQITTEREDWTYDIDMKLGYNVRLTKNTVLGITMDMFNVFDFQGVTSRDETYTLSDVLPCQGGTLPTCVHHSVLVTEAFNPKTEVNPNYGNPTSYQAPRQFRFGARVTF
jgi:TonB dependent receptor